MAKIALAVLAALCAVLVASALPANQILQHNEFAAVSGVRDLVDKILEVLNQVRAQISEVAQKAQDAIKKALDDLNQRISDISTTVQEQIDELVEKAQERGVDVKTCVDDQKEAIQKLADDLKTQAQTCLNTPIEELKEELKTLDPIKTEAEELVADVKKQRDECAKHAPWESAICIVSIFTKEQSKAAALFSHTVQAGSAVAGKALSIAPEAAACTREVTADARGKAQTIFQTVQTCIEEKSKQ